MKFFAMGAMFALVNASAVEMEREPLLSWAPTKCWPPQSSPCKEPKRDYFVPNFGADHDVINSAKSIKDAETKLKHKWTPKKNPKPTATDYFVPNFGMDSDIVTTQSNMAKTEATLGAWNPKVDKEGAYIVPTV